MPTFAYFEDDPAVKTVTAATAAEAAKQAAQAVGDQRSEGVEGTFSYRLWFVSVDGIKAVDATYTVEERSTVTVQAVP